LWPRSLIGPRRDEQERELVKLLDGQREELFDVRPSVAMRPGELFEEIARGVHDRDRI
jgi:hypothetical protein